MFKLQIHKIIWFIFLLNCGTIQLTEPKINDTLPAPISQKAAQKIFITINHGERVPGKSDMSVLTVSEAFIPALCNFEHAKEPEKSPEENIESHQKIREQKDKVAFIKFMKRESLREPNQRYYTLWEVHQWSDNPAPFMYLMLHGLTLGLIPYYSSSEIRYDYLVVQNGEEVAKASYPLEMSTLTWSPLILTGNTKFPRDVKTPKFAQNCMEIAEKLPKGSMNE